MTLYELWQSPQAFLEIHCQNLKSCGLEQFKFDPCLFFGIKVICVVHVDDIISWSKDTLEINSSAMYLREFGVNLE
jgi:hypothetical protein